MSAHRVVSLLCAALLAPAAARAETVLVFDDTSPSSAHLACQQAYGGGSCTLVSTAQDFASQATAGWDIVVVDTARIWFGDSGGESALLSLLGAAVPVVFHSHAMESNTAFMQNLGVSIGGASGNARQIYQHGGTLFTSPNSVPSNIQGTNNAQVNGVEVPPHSSDPTAFSAAIYDSIASTAVAATVARSQKVVVLGFSSDEYGNPDADGDGVKDVVELLENAMHVVTSCSDLDLDGDGTSACDGDCDDDDGSIGPGEVDVPGDGVDQNCDGHDASDGDGDGHAPTADGGDDCDDGDADVHPGAPETANGFDDDCDGSVDEDTTVTDDDGDGYCEGPEPCIDGAAPGDCDDGDRDFSPDADEACFDQVDNDCDGATDAQDADCGGEGGDDDDSAGDDDTSGGGPGPSVGGCQCDSDPRRAGGAALGGLMVIGAVVSAGTARRRR